MKKKQPRPATGEARPVIYQIGRTPGHHHPIVLGIGYNAQEMWATNWAEDAAELMAYSLLKQVELSRREKAAANAEVMKIISPA